MTVTDRPSDAFESSGYETPDGKQHSPSFPVTGKEASLDRKSRESPERGDSGFNSSDDNLSATSNSESIEYQSVKSNDATLVEISLAVPQLPATSVRIPPPEPSLIKDLYDGVEPDILRIIREGSKVSLADDFKVPIDQVPPWYDAAKCKLGRQFGQKYAFGINFAEMVSLYLLFLPKQALEPLIFTGNSHTPYKAFKRYLSTSLRVKSWVDTDVWDPETTGYKNLRTVRAMHLNVSKKLNGCPRSEIDELGSMKGERGKEGVWCPSYENLRKDLQGSCPFSMSVGEKTAEVTDSVIKESVYVSQLHMSLTQFGFVGLILLYPEKFGAGSATEADLDGFAHLWKCIGYLLGIKDEFNFCNGSLAEVKQRTLDTLNIIYIPLLRSGHVSAEWEHMSRCMVEGISYYVPGVSFEVSFSYLCWVLGVPVPSISSGLTMYQNFMLYLTKVTMCHTTNIPGVLKMHNYLLKRTLEKVQRRPKEWHDKLEQRIYDYQKDCKSKDNTAVLKVEESSKL